jgi:uncharacterized protein YbaP (TraB family)
MTESSLLWEIKGDSVQKSYLFGTMHLIEKDYFVFTKKLEKLLSKSDVLVMELPGLPDQQEALRYVTLEEGNFSDYFSDAQMDSIYNWAKAEMGLSKEGFNASFSTMKPFVVVQMAVQMHFMGKTESYELTFQNLANEYQLAIEGLETVAEQMALFDNLEDTEMNEIVMETIRKDDESLQLTKSMMEIYNRQQIDSLYMLILEEGGTISDKQSDFLDNRNKNWIPKIEAAIKKQKSFIAVGAGHLGGPQGVIRLLEQEGYSVKPVKL